MTLEEPTVVPDVSAHTVSPGKQAAQAVASTNTENGHADEKKPSDAAPAVVSEKEAVPAATIPDKVHIPQVSPASAEADAPAATDTKAETDDKAEADVKAETDGKAETNGKAEAKAPSKVKFGAVEEVPAADVAAEEDDEDYVPGKEGEDEMEDDDNEEQVAPLNLPKGLVSHLMTTGNLGSKPLHAAVQKDNADEIRKLLGKGGEMEGKVDDADPFLYTALHAAAEQGAAKACEVLLKFGANKDLPTKMHDSTPLHYAAFEGHDDVLKLLLEAGANKDALTDDKRTPLFQAAFRGHLDSVRVLLEYGADCTIKNSEEKSPADVAENEDVVTLLTEQPTKKARTEE